MQGGRNTWEKTGARRWLIVTLVCGLTAFAAPVSATQTSSPEAATSSQATYINSQWVEQPVMPTYFSPNDISDLIDDIYCGALGEDATCNANILINYVDYIHWSSWGGEQAVGSGRVALLDEFGSTSPVTVTLSQPVRCAGQRIYTRYSLQLGEGAPAPRGWPEGQTGRFPCGRVRVSGYAPNDGVVRFDGIHDPSASEPYGTSPARWRPRLPKFKRAELDFAWPQWKHWGKRRAVGTLAFAVVGNAFQPHRGWEWPAKLEFRRPIWCPRASGFEGAITYGSLKATFYGTGLRFQHAVSEEELLQRRTRLARQIGKAGVKRRVYRQEIRPTLEDCLDPIQKRQVLRPPVIERYQ